MSDTPQVTPTVAPEKIAPEKVYDFNKTPAGGFVDDFFNNEPVDFVLMHLYIRAGVPSSHSLWQPLVNVRALHPSENRIGIPCASTPFPPEGYTKRLVSVEDWMACLKANTVTLQHPVSEPVASENIASDSIATNPISVDAPKSKK